MKKTLVTTMFISCFALAGAQDTIQADTLWKFSGITSLSFSQLSLTNWAAGGSNSIAGNALVKLSPDYDDGTMHWDNDLILGFGLINQGNDPTRKSDDQIELSSKFGYRASKNWFYSAMLSFKTQFAKGYDEEDEENRPKISNFMAPGYLSLALGMDYKPNDKFSLLLSPVSSKVTFVLDEDLSEAGSFGLDPGSKVRAEMGATVKATFKQEILKNVVLDTKLDLFSNYFDHPEWIDVNWDLLLTLKVNEYISASLMTQLIYDKDIEFGVDTTGDGEYDTFESRVQFKELFGLGFAYNF
jgi:opacity protein-like surface antigen